MPDVYSVITTVDPAVVAQVADAMEVSATDPQHREMVAAYLADLDLAGNARVLEVGCGTGAIARELARGRASARCSASTRRRFCLPGREN